jgi:hypothetical protein
MNLTVTQARQAEKAAKVQRFACLPMLKVNEAIASPAQLALYTTIKACKDADALDKFLSDEKVINNFRSRVFYYGDVAP